MQKWEWTAVVQRNWRNIWVLSFLLASTAEARKTNHIILEDPFDVAAGGASLTRATRDSVVLANPALMPYGAKIFRWLGTQFNVLTNPESIDFLQAMSTGQGSAGQGVSDFVERVFQTPVHVGLSNLTSFITNNLGFSLFFKGEVDIDARELGLYGMPEVLFMFEGYGGAAIGAGVRLLPMLSVGVTAKYLFAAEPAISVSLLDSEEIAALSDPLILASEAYYGQGLSMDAGALFFLQGNYMDLRLAAKVDDFGGTKLAGTSEGFKQTAHAGVGLTLHTNADALHLSVDYRDILGVYEEALFKRIYAGARLTVRQYLAVAGGLYNGYPSAGIRADFIFFQVGATMYTRELGLYPGANPRTLYVLSLMTGF